LKKAASPYPRLTTTLLVLTLLGLFFPLLQNHWKIVSLKGLNGVVAAPDSLQPAPHWWDRSWQEQQEQQIKDSLVLRPACVRLRNQLEYSFFHKLNAQQIYEYNGIFYRFYRPDFNETQNVQDTAVIRRHVAQLKAFQEKLGEDRCPVVTLIAPSKAHYFINSLPQRNRAQFAGTNYQLYLDALREAGLEVLDANHWFLQTRGKQEAPVFGKGGIHWTLYASVLAMDSLVQRVGSLTDKTFQRPDYYLPPGYHLYDPDQDIARLCNLMYMPKDPALRTVEFNPVAGKKKLKALIISDSFFHVISWSALRNQVFDEQSMFLYYYKTHFDAWNQAHPIDTQAIDKLLAEADCVLILSDIVNLEQFGFGFLEQYVAPRVAN